MCIRDRPEPAQAAGTVTAIALAVPLKSSTVISASPGKVMLFTKMCIRDRCGWAWQIWNSWWNSFYWLRSPVRCNQERFHVNWSIHGYKYLPDVYKRQYVHSVQCQSSITTQRLSVPVHTMISIRPTYRMYTITSSWPWKKPLNCYRKKILQVLDVLINTAQKACLPRFT